MDSVKETHNMEDVLKTDRCSFNDSTDVWAGVNYHVGYNREKVLQYFFHAKGFEIPGNDLILIQDYSHNIAD